MSLQGASGKAQKFSELLEYELTALVESKKRCR